jgi:hypothetical protein
MPPNLETAKEVAKLALKYLNEKKGQKIVKMVLENLIIQLEDPHFGENDYPSDPANVSTWSNYPDDVRDD